MDDYDSRFPQYIEQLNAETLGYGADHPGVSVETMPSFLAGGPPQAKAYLASLYATVNNGQHTSFAKQFSSLAC
ncbi:hypothetical protein [Pandoraea horticolens]|uniref:hypothetical protein n=1 Tax=Pandoraea horticolens TaxID=2508298 RepID=UPI0012430F02|nr:hypothetical protein [Pandoraea horticolens]